MLIVEDNAGDAFIDRGDAQRAKDGTEVMVVEDGVEAMTLLQNKENIVPDLVILDLNLPGMDGFEILELMKGSDEMRKDTGHRSRPAHFRSEVESRQGAWARSTIISNLAHSRRYKGSQIT